MVYVSEKVWTRMRHAKHAIRFVKTAIPHSGNQRLDFILTGGNSTIRGRATRQFGHTKNVERVAGTVACTRGGFCGEHAVLSLHYLGSKNVRDHFSYYMVLGVDHAFVLIGDPERELHRDIVVVDPWVTNPKPVRLVDYFLYQEVLDGAEIRAFKYEVKRGKGAREERRVFRDLASAGVDLKRLSEKTLDATITWDVRNPFHGDQSITYRLEHKRGVCPSDGVRGSHRAGPLAPKPRGRR